MRAPDVRLDLQHLRHTAGAGAVRRVLATWLMGPGSWPVVFRAPAPDEPLPAGSSEHLYVHLPFCATLCPHCPYNKVRYSGDAARSYGVALVRELSAYLARDDIPPVRSLYFGGGTPSLTPALIGDVLGLVRPHLRPDAEVGVEVHPRDARGDRLAHLRELGVTRVSVGVESFDDRLLRLLERGYTADAAAAALAAARAAGFECVDANLIYAIPGQEVPDVARDARRCLDAGVDQVSAYPLFGFAHTPLGRGAERPTYGERGRATAARELARACRAGGLERTSVWSFTRPGVAPYSTVTHEDYIGFGAGAGSKVRGLFWFNTFSVPEYTRTEHSRPALVMQATPRMQRLHWVYWQYYQLHIGAEPYRVLFGGAVDHDFAAGLRVARALGWVHPDADGWRVTERGATWGHKLQALFSLSSIDTMWSRCQGDAWPDEVSLG